MVQEGPEPSGASFETRFCKALLRMRAETVDGDQAPVFDQNFAVQFADLLRWRRDVRRFRSERLREGLVEELLAQAECAPSVGHSQPWRWVRVHDPAQRVVAQDSFARCNAEALASYEGERARLYASLKLDGLREAPEQIAVFCDHGTARGHGLGRRTMPEMLDYSVVAAITQFWLAARGKGTRRRLGLDPRAGDHLQGAGRPGRMEAHRLAVRRAAGGGKRGTRSGAGGLGKRARPLRPRA